MEPADEQAWQFGELKKTLVEKYGEQDTPAELKALDEAWQAEQMHREAQRGCRAERPGFEEIRRQILEKGRHAGRIYWSKDASEEDMRRLAREVLQETDPGRLYSFRRMFELRTFPLPIEPLLGLAWHADQGVAWAAMAALKRHCDPRIRALALRAAKKPEWRGLAVEMLA